MPFCFCGGSATKETTAATKSTNPGDFLRLLLGGSAAWTPEAAGGFSNAFNAISVSSELLDERVAALKTGSRNSGFFDALEPYLYDALRRRLGLDVISDTLSGYFEEADATALLSALAVRTGNKRRLFRWLSRNVGQPLPWFQTINSELIDSGDGLSDLLCEGDLPLVLVHLLTPTNRPAVSAFLRTALPRQFPENSAHLPTAGITVHLPYQVTPSRGLRTVEDAVVVVVDSITPPVNLVPFAAASLIFADDRKTDVSTYLERVALLVQSSPRPPVVVLVPTTTATTTATPTATTTSTTLSKRLSLIPGFSGVLSLSDGVSVNRSLTDRVDGSVLAPSVSVLRGISTHPTLSSRAADLMHLLEQTHRANDGRVKSAAFPFTRLYERQLWLAKRERSLREQGGLEAMQQLAKIHKEIAELRNIVSTVANGSVAVNVVVPKVSRLLEFFCESILLKPSEGFSGFALAKHLETWKQRHTPPLLLARREALERGNTAALSQVNAALAEIDDVTVDAFWTELETMMVFFGSENPALLPVPKELIQTRFAEALLDDGHPLQLLKGKPLHLADGAMLKSLLGRVSQEGNRVYVISVIGAQSSAKSTLLNFLFGCEFETRSGRCTKGLYATVLSLGSTPGGASSGGASGALGGAMGAGTTLVVLDSEGLLSVEAEEDHLEFGGSEVFDGQMTLLAMACSHLVLINHKGEISRQLQDLLEVCMFAMKHLRVTHGIGPAGGDAVYQPLINFVLRDQQDRGVSVHEDTLRHMRRHLVECGERVGLKVDEVIRIEGKSVFLLPSAFVNASGSGGPRRTGGSGRNFQTVNPLFSEEVLNLRNRINEQLSQETPWTSLSQWFSHVHTVWETLTLFGHNLLHYKTIQEIELRKELDGLAEEVVKEVVEAGYKVQASELVARYEGMLQAPNAAAAGPSKGEAAELSPDSRRMEGIVGEGVVNLGENHKTSLDTFDLELCGQLGSLKTTYQKKVVARFEEMTNDKRFPVSLKEPVRQRLSSALDFPADNVLYSWKLLLRAARDGEEVASMWRFFAERMQQGAALSEGEAGDLFEREWTAYEAQCVGRLEAVKRDRTGLAYEVSVLFNQALAKVARERPDFAVLKEVGPVYGDGEGTMLTEGEDAWKQKYVRLPAPAAGAAGAAVDSKDVGRDLRTLKTLVEELVDTVDGDIVRLHSLNEAMAVDWLRRSHDVVTSEAERRVRVVAVKRPQLLGALHLQLRHAAVAALWGEEEGRYDRHLRQLRSLKEELKTQLVLLARNNASDADRARVFAARYHASVLQWLDFVVTSFAAEVRAVVLAEMPDPAKAHDRAFQCAFGARNWLDVLEYCLDVNCYLEKLFLQLFWRRQVVVVSARQGLLEGRVAEMYSAVKALVLDWSAAAAGEAGSESSKILALHEFIDARKASAGESVKTMAGIFPQTVNFEVRDKKIFAHAFISELSTLFADSFPTSISDRVTKALAEQSVEAWSLLKGCSARCPLCGSKCDRIGEHSDHHCEHHLLPGFHGWMERIGGKSLLNLCQSDEVHNGTYQCRDGVWRPLAEYLLDSHRNWCPFPRGFSEAQQADENVLRAAWVNVKKALEKYFKPMKAVNPPEWDCFIEEDRQLTEADLEKAKKTVKLLRSKKYTPENAGIDLLHVSSFRNQAPSSTTQ